MALYLSILKKGGLHQETENGWKFQLPSDERDYCRLLPSLNRITALIRQQGTDALIPVLQVFQGLSQVPFGIREGLQPFILAIYLSTHHQRVALYEDGTYLPEVGGEAFLRLMKEPQFFHIQYCELDSVRADVFTKLLHLLQIDPRDAVQDRRH
jgi:predicted transposase YdaD